jgi:hypothetical protein
MNKTEYRENRKKGLRGQGKHPVLSRFILTSATPPGGNREQRRKRLLDRLFNKKGYRNGKKIKASK